MSSERQAGAEDEIEITEEMIEAGTHELARYNSEFESAEDAVRRIFEAVAELAPGHGMKILIGER